MPAIQSILYDAMNTRYTLFEYCPSSKCLSIAFRKLLRADQCHSDDHNLGGVTAHVRDRGFHVIVLDTWSASYGTF